MHDIIATSPIVDCGPGMAATRVVLRKMTGKYVVHKQRFYEDGSTAFDHGNYFMDYEPHVVLRAWQTFHDRSLDLLHDGPLYDLKTDPVRFQDLERGG